MIRKLVSFIRHLDEYLYYRFLHKRPRLDRPREEIGHRYLIAGGDKQNQGGRDFRQYFPRRFQSIVKEADVICDHVFDLLGSGPQKLSPEGEGYQPIDWHADFISGYRWNPGTFYRNIPVGHRRGVDIKVPWELSRFQHLICLGQAYCLTEDKKYADEFVNQIRDWIKQNRVGFGVNWRCTMDAAIRAANWLAAQEFFAESGDVPEDFWNDFYGSLYEHGRFIRRHLENKGSVRGNHYIADLAGLYFIAVYCPFFEESRAWRTFAVAELEKEMLYQVYPDGCSFEASTSYHRLALEMFFYAALLGKRAGRAFSGEYNNRLKKMFTFSLYCIKPDGRIPQIGDNDNGRFLLFSRRPVLDHTYLLSLAAINFSDSQFKRAGQYFDEEAFWVFGKEGKNIYDSMEEDQAPLDSREFRDAGWYILRDEADYCFVSCGPNGQNGEGGHAHNDKLSFELMLNGKDVIIDPGTFAYTSYPDERNKFRSTAYHNTIVVNGKEQNAIPDKDLFGLADEVEIKGAAVTQNEAGLSFKGTIHYAGAAHTREIVKDKASSDWTIKDELEVSGPHKMKAHLYFSPQAKVEDGEIIDAASKRPVASIKISGGEWTQGEYAYSPQYGEKVKADCLEIALQASTLTVVVSPHVIP
jgi:hypothetical protein